MINKKRFIKATLTYINPGFSLSIIRQDITEQIISHLAEFQVESDGTLFFQATYDIPRFILEKDSVRQWLKRRSSSSSVTFLVDPWYLGHAYGYDVHTIFE